MHNWPDHECLRILRHIRAIASPDSKLVLVDDIMMYACREETRKPRKDGSDDNINEDRSDSHPPKPLLDNWGAANKLSYAFDVMVGQLLMFQLDHA